MNKKRIKLVYLLFLAIPLLFYCLWNVSPVLSSKKHSNYFYFSVRTTGPASISLFSGKDSLSSWNINSAGYKYLEYAGKLNDTGCITLKLKSLKANDTIKFLAINQYRNNTIYSFYDYKKPNCITTNALAVSNEKYLSLTVQQSNVPVKIQLQNSGFLHERNIKSFFRNLIFLLFAIVFILIFIIAPPVRYFVTSIILLFLLMLLFYWIEHNETYRVAIKTKVSVQRFETFFNDNPGFLPAKSFAKDSVSNYFSHPVDLKNDNFLRFDLDGFPSEIGDIYISVQSGFVKNQWNLASVDPGKLMMNDLIIRNGKFYASGVDPYIVLNSTYFHNKFLLLMMVRHCLFLFISLFIFLIILLNHFWLARLINDQLKPVFFLFLIIPLIWYFLPSKTNYLKLPNKNDKLYFSVKTSRTSTIDLINGDKLLASWKIDSLGYKYLQYDGKKINDSAAVSIRVSGLSTNDTLSFLAVNLFRDNKVISLFKNNKQYSRILNATAIDGLGAFDALVKNAATPASINFQPFYLWQKSNLERNANILFYSLFILIFLLILLFRPPAKYFILATTASVIFMLVIYWLGRDVSEQVAMQTDAPVKSVDFFFNDNPYFNSDHKTTISVWTSFFKTQLDLSKYNFLRCDVDESTKMLKCFKVITRTGVLNNEMDFSSIPLDKMLINDMKFRGGVFYICGNDPYFCLTTDYFSNRIQSLLIMRRNIYLFLTLFVFLVLISIHSRFKEPKFKSLFVAASFLTVIFSGYLLWFFNSDLLVMQTEKRNASLLPVFRADSADVYVHNLEAYLKDQLPGRNRMITMNNLTKYTVLGQFNDPNVYFGKDGWMFYIGQNAKEMYENHHPLSAQELEKMKSVLVERRNWLRERGMKFYLMFPPMSNFVYPEKIGDGLYCFNKKRKLEQLADYLTQHTDLQLIDVFDPIVEAKKKYRYDMFYKTDAHWTQVGAYFAYAAIIDRLRKDFPDIMEAVPFRNIKWYEIDNTQADLVEMISLEGYITRHDYLPICRKFKAATDTVFYNYPEYTSPFPALYEINNNVKTPKMLMFRDSYANYLIPYLSGHFHQCSYIWSPVFLGSIVEKEKPDIVIWEMAERMIYDLLAENPALPDQKNTN